MPTESNQSRAQITVHLDKRTPLKRIWRYVGYDEPNYTYTPNGRTLLAKLAGMSDAPYFIRCHFLLCSGDGTPRLKWGSSNVYTENATGNAVYSWDIIDRILDTYVELGCIPFVELGFTPQALTTALADVAYDDPRHGGWRYPPKDYGRWLELIRNLASHCLARYGLAEVHRWYWELWNEPDIFYWQGSVEDFCRLYDYTVAGLQSVLPQARMGGPATTSSATRPESGQFLRTFLEHVTRGTNTVTGQTGARIDFVSFHAKGGGFAPAPHAAKATPTLFTLLSNVQAGLDVVGDFPELAGREVILSECDPDGWAAGSIADNPNLFYRNTEYYASYVACTVNKLIDLAGAAGVSVDGMLTWAFQFENRDYFEGFRTLSTNGIDKPVLNVLRMLAKLGSVRLQLTSDRSTDPVSRGNADGPHTLPDIAGVAAIDETDAVQVFLSSHHDDWDVVTPSQVVVRFLGMEAGRSYTVYRSLVAKDRSNSYSAWVNMGKPQAPNAAQIAELEQAARLRTEEAGRCTGGDNGLEFTLSLPSHSACLLQFVPG